MPWLSLLLTLQQALWIDVPFIHQDKSGCGSASIWMVMKYWQPDAAIDVDDIQRQLYSKTAGGIYAKDMARYFESHGYRTFTIRGEWSDLEEHVSKGRPLIVSLERNRLGVPLHYVVVAGVDSVSNIVLVNDPAQRKLLSIARDDFERTWEATDHWTLLALPELDLASKAFRDENLPETLRHLNSALKSNPSDAYLNDFLATVHFVQNNTEAALKHWNREGKPYIENIRIDPPLRTDPVLLDKAFSFSRGSVLNLSDFEITQARLSALGVFSRYRMELSPAGDEGFDVTLRAAERSQANVWSWFRGLPFQSVNPEFSNLGGKGLNVATMLRWDSNKRRAAGFFEAPLGGDPKWRYRVSVDGRGETWADAAGDFRMKKVLATAAIHAVPSGRWSWTSGGSVSSRWFSNSFSSGVELKYAGSLTRTFVRDPARHLNLDSSIDFETGKLWTSSPLRFVKMVNATQFRWRALTSELRVGRSIGQAPFDERFVIGTERDSDLWLRAHPATIDGRKNAANTSSSFAITNTDLQKTIYNAGWFHLSSGPFLDTAKSSISKRWLLDTGVELRVNVLGSFGVRISYGQSLADAHKGFFMRAEP